MKNLKEYIGGVIDHKIRYTPQLRIRHHHREQDYNIEYIVLQWWDEFSDMFDKSMLRKLSNPKSKENKEYSEKCALCYNIKDDIGSIMDILSELAEKKLEDM